VPPLSDAVVRDAIAIDDRITELVAAAPGLDVVLASELADRAASIAAVCGAGGHEPVARLAAAVARGLRLLAAGEMNPAGLPHVASSVLTLRRACEALVDPAVPAIDCLALEGARYDLEANFPAALDRVAPARVTAPDVPIGSLVRRPGPGRES